MPSSFHFYARQRAAGIKKKNREALQIMKFYIFFDAIDLDLLLCFPNLAGIRVTWRTCEPHSQRVWGWAWGFAFLTTSVLSLDESMFFAYCVALYYFIIVLFVRFESLFNHNFLLEAIGFKPWTFSIFTEHVINMC